MALTTDLTAADSELVTACAAVVDVPKAAPPDSFVLHAPLELLARALLLPHVAEEHRPLARRRIEWLAETYDAAGPDAAPSDASTDAPPLDEVLVSLAAAGHAPILLSLRPRVGAAAGTFGDRLVAAELERHPDWRLTWPIARTTAGAGSGDLEQRLASPRSPGDPGSNFIHPTMHLVDASGLAAEVLDEPLRGLGLDDARRILLRAAARSMLQDDPTAAPYGWTHCLTMPQAVLDVGRDVDPDLAVAVAATYVLGFRATLGRVALDPDRTPIPGTAAHHVWTTTDEDLPSVTRDLATFGAVHPDAHVAKYTLAGLDAATADPGAARLFLAAVAHLHDWWRANPPAQHPSRGDGSTTLSA